MCYTRRLVHLAKLPLLLYRERQTLEKQKSPNANEVLLTDHDGNVYEGMASNFFAIINENGSPTLVTASLDCVLLGTIMKIVLHVCDERKIPVKWAFPSLKDASDGKWEGCFISSKLYSELPLHKMYLYLMHYSRHLKIGTAN
jgi:branched-subunit amino acid aminotransferase/4-amino-4-deoxychorismate lyase